MTDEVLIIGAGPTGMTLALQLRAYGVPVRVIEKAVETRGGSKALSVNPSTLYVFDQLGVADRVIRAGRPLGRATVICRGHRMAAVDLQRLPYRYNNFVMLPQPKTEQILGERLREVGVEIERGVTFTSLQSTDEGVTVSTVDREGSTERRRYAYVVGCDGARSAVREALGISFTGFDYPMHFLLADARAQWPGRLHEGTYAVEDDGFLILLPLTGELHRVVVKVSGPFVEHQKVSFDMVKDAVNACVGDRLVLTDPTWVSGAPFYNRLASSVRSGRVFLAGDSAHLFSPIGGFGMNTGVGDAFNLGWKLAYVMRGRASAGILDTYEAERLLLARRLVFLNDRSTSLIARLDRHEKKDEELWLPLARNRPNLRAMPYNLAGLSHSYEAAPSGRAGRAALPGCVAPFVDAVRSRAPEGEDQRGRHLLVVNASSPGSGWPRCAATIEELRVRYRSFLQVMVFGDRAACAPLSEGVLWRPDATALEGCGFPDPGVALVRPDFYIEHVSALEDGGDSLAKYLADHYRPC